MNIYWAFPEQKWNVEPIPEGKDLDPNRAFLPLQLAKKALQGLGHVVLPINNRYRSQEISHDGIVFSFDAMHLLPKDILRKHPVKRLIHFFMEAPMVGMRYYSHKYQQDVFEKADTVFIQDPSYIHTRFRNSKKLKAFKFAHSHLGIEDSLFSHSSRKLLVLINANKGIGLKQSLKRLMLGVNPLSYYPNWLLRERMRWIHDLARKKEIDVYGYGWNRYSLELSHVSSPLENQAWKGTVEGPKFPVLAEYDFCLCFENSRFPGYVTEKIFD
ncbi:hypothetical protein KKI24_26580, partial [bacterium]|nr:hypothetical protein [bacterium]